jgi:CxC2 like cysteine cluster associated with KDZ transposases
VIDISGIHSIAIDFCDCRTNGIIPRHIQILRAGWFPATFDRPQTAFTFKCLDFYHELTLQGKVNAYDFCRTLRRLTDSLELNDISVCFTL